MVGMQKKKTMGGFWSYPSAVLAGSMFIARAIKRPGVKAKSQEKKESYYDEKKSDAKSYFLPDGFISAGGGLSSGGFS